MIPQYDDSDTSGTNAAGIGAVGRRDSQYGTAVGRQASRRQSTMSIQQAPPVQSNGYSQPLNVGPSPSSPSNQLVRNATQRPQSVSPAPGASPSPSGQLFRHNTQQSRSSQRVPPQDPYAEPIDPTAETFIKIGENAYKADPNRDPQNYQQPQGSVFNNQPLVASPTKAIGNGAVDPLAKHMEDLKNSVQSTGSVRRKSLRRSTAPETAKPIQQSQPPQQPSNLSPPSSSMSNLAIATSPSRSTSPRDYRNSAELVVGVHPSASAPAQPSRSPSPNPPTAAFMKPPPSSGLEIVQDVLADYQQSLPGERKSISRSNSPVAVGRRLSISGPPPPQQQQQHGHAHTASQSSISLGLGLQQGQLQQIMGRPPSVIGHPGIGAHGGSRSNSPQPPSRGPSPAPPASVRSRNDSVGGNNGFISAPSGPPVARAPSPNTVGIALDPSGRVMHDEMAQRYQQQQQLQQVQHKPSVQQIMRPPSQQHQRPPQQPVQQQQPQQQPVQQQQQQQYMQHPLQQHQPPQQYVPAQTQPVQSQARRPTYMASTGPVVPPPPPINTYNVAPPAAMYQAPAPTATPVSAATRPSYVQQTPIQPQQPQQPMYTGYQAPTPAPTQGPVQVAPLAMTVYQQPQPQQPQQLQYQQPQHTGYYGHQQHVPPPQQQQQQHQPPPQQQQQQPQQQQQQLQLRAPFQQQQQYGGYRGPSPVVQRTPSPQPPPAGQLVAPPTGQTTEEGHGILFYVKALYDYVATIDEEFDFQAGDIIAVTHTPEDGWWSGELLDEERRQPGRHVFPSNFVCLF
ncbi:hypothetical protein H0H93_007811 [Arthromyces matolae]|nr:hypothetical protein H0H93_007811 [Arthromyces matolae]